MTISTNYGDLLKRQAWLQEAGAAHLGTCTPDQVRVALLTEIGELAQELKPEWAWWSKSGDKREVDRDKVLGEAADVLHFALLFDIVMGHKGDDFAPLSVWHDADDRHLCHWLDMSDFSYGWPVAVSLCTIVARYGFTPEDLARAYWAKTEVNLKRWGTA